MTKQWNRRDFLRIAGATTAGVVTAACAPQVIKEAVEVEKEVTRIVEKQVEAPRKPVTIRVHYMSGPSWAWIQERMPLFEERNPYIKVEDEAAPGAEYFAKMRTMYAGGQIGDVLWTWHENGAFQEFWQKGVFQPIDDLVEAEQFDLGQYYKISIELMTREGKLYMLPEYIHPGPTGYHYNKDRCDEVGITYVPETPASEADIHDDWTIDDFYRVSEKLTKVEGDSVAM